MKQAASLILRRGDAVYWVKRAANARFLSLYNAFPGGMVEAQEDPRLAAIRETFEETGYLLATGTHDDLPAFRAALRAERLDFAEACAERGLVPRTEALTALGQIETPDYLVAGITTHYFVVDVPASADPQITANDPELQSGGWIKPADALAAWGRGEVLLAPPTQALLRALATGEAPQLGGPYSHSVIRPGIVLFPQRSPTLPPATHTNAYVFGHSQMVVVDPAALDDTERGRLDDYLEAHIAQGHRLVAVLLTHHHADHVGGAAHLARRFDAPIWAHKLTDELLSLEIARHLADADTIDLGEMQLDVLHTPGHAVGHLCYVDRDTRTGAVGDMVAGVGTILIAPDEGDMAEYLAQLERLKSLNLSALMPAHGPVIGGANAYLSHYIAHRLKREAKVLAALTHAPQSVRALVEIAYEDAPPMAKVGVNGGLAGLSLVSHLIKLRADGAALCDGNQQWSLTP